MSDGLPVPLTKFGVRFDGETPSAKPMQAAVDSGEPRLVAGAGRCLLEQPISLGVAAQAITGCGFSSRTTTSPTGGTIFVPTFPPADGAAAFVIGAENVRLSDLEIAGGSQPTPGPGWAPVVTPAGILDQTAAYATTGGSDPSLTNIMFRGLSRGFVMRGGGRAELHGIFGQTFGPLLDVDGCYDVLRLVNLHSWQFWSFDPNVAAWMSEHAVATRWGRCDNPNVANLFALGAKAALHFTDSSATPPGGTSRGQFVNVGVDSARYGLLADGVTYQHDASFANFYVFCSVTSEATPSTASRCIFLAGKQTHTFQFSNVDLAGSQYEAIRVEAASKIRISGGRVRSYNQAASQKFAGPAIYLGDGATVDRALLEIDTGDGNGAPAIGGPGQSW